MCNIAVLGAWVDQQSLISLLVPLLHFAFVRALMSTQFLRIEEIMHNYTAKLQRSDRVSTELPAGKL